jgi:hypothetical protein
MLHVGISFISTPERASSVTDIGYEWAILWNSIPPVKQSNVHPNISLLLDTSAGYEFFAGTIDKRWHISV